MKDSNEVVEVEYVDNEEVEGRDNLASRGKLADLPFEGASEREGAKTEGGGSTAARIASEVTDSAGEGD